MCVEAAKETFGALSENFRGREDRVVCLNYAVTDAPALTVPFFYAPAGSGLSTLNKQEWFDDPKSRFYNQPCVEEVAQTITLDRLIQTYGVPDLVKIDVEGAEDRVIGSLSRKVPTLCFEWASELRHVAFRCIDRLNDLGFTEYCVQLGDEYTFRPSAGDYTSDVASVKALLESTTDREHWGMIWAS